METGRGDAAAATRLFRGDAERLRYYVLLACMGIYVVVCVLLIGICGQWNKRLPIDLPPDDLEAGRRRASTFL